MPEPATKPTWITRSNNLARIYGGGRADQLPARGALGGRLPQLVAAGKITVVTRLSIEAAVGDAGRGGIVYRRNDKGPAQGSRFFSPLGANRAPTQAHVRH